MDLAASLVPATLAAALALYWNDVIQALVLAILVAGSAVYHAVGMTATSLVFDYLVLVIYGLWAVSETSRRRRRIFWPAFALALVTGGLGVYFYTLPYEYHYTWHALAGAGSFFLTIALGYYWDKTAPYGPAPRGYAEVEK